MITSHSEFSYNSRLLPRSVLHNELSIDIAHKHFKYNMSSTYMHNFDIFKQKVGLNFVKFFIENSFTTKINTEDDSYVSKKLSQTIITPSCNRCASRKIIWSAAKNSPRGPEIAAKPVRADRFPTS